MPTRITFDITQTSFLLNPNENYTIKFGDGYMVDTDGTTNLDLDIITFNTTPVFVTATVGPYYPNEKSLFLSFNKNVSYNAGSIYIYAEDSTLVREIDSTTLSTVDTDSNLIEIPIPFPAEALEDNARYWVVLDDDLFVSTSDRVVSKFNSWTNGRTEFEFETGAEGLDDFVAWLDASVSSLTADVIKIKSFEATCNVDASVMCHPYKKKSFTLSSPAYQQLYPSTVFQSYIYTGSAVATDVDDWYLEYRSARLDDQSDSDDSVFAINENTSAKTSMRSLTVLDGWDYENKQYLRNRYKETEDSGKVKNAVAFCIHQPYNTSTYDFYMDSIMWTEYPLNQPSGNPTISEGSINYNAVTTPIGQYTVAAGWGNLMVVGNPTFNNNRGRLEVYTGTGEMSSGGSMFRTDEPILNIPNTYSPSDSADRQSPNFGRSLAISHKYVAAANWFYAGSSEDYRQVQIYDVKTGDLVQTISTGTNAIGNGRLALMKHPDTEDYILIGDKIYDITDGSLHQTLNIGTFSLSRLNTSNSETHLAIIDSGIQNLYLFDTTTDSFTSLGSTYNPNTQTNNTFDYFGISLDIKENTLVVGASREDQDHPDPNINYTAFDGGTVYVYK